MKEILAKYLPENAVSPCFELIKANNIYLRIVNERKTRHGDYRRLPDGQHLITMNATANKYRFLITFIHEVSHLVAFERFGRLIKPHGNEWKYIFQQMMIPFIIPEIFPKQLLEVLRLHFLNPMSSSDIDPRLAIALKQYDSDEKRCLIYEVPLGSIFRIKDGRVFRKGKRRIKCFDCIELSTGQRYIFQPHAEIELVKT